MEEDKELACETSEFVQHHRVARIPWLPFKESTVKLKDTKFFQEMMTCGEERGLRVNLHAMLTNTFPIFLPKRYHAMDCLELHKNSPDGEYWANASYFLYRVQVFGYPFHKELCKILETKISDDFVYKLAPAFSREMLLALKKEKWEECQSAAEFLLEPWILVQLPFQPLLFHQWSVALLAEALNFKKELCEIYSIPKSLISLGTKLTEMCNLMFQTAFKFFDHFSSYMYDGDESLSDSVSSNFLVNLPNVLPIIEFVLSDECKNIVKAIKKIAWRVNSFDHGVNNNIWFESGGENFSFCYNMNYWKQVSAIHSICSSNFRTNCFPQDYDEHLRKKEIAPSEVEGLKNLVEEKLIKTGRLKGESKEFIFSLLQGLNLYSLITSYRAYLHYFETSRESKGIEEPFWGVMYDIFTLYSDATLAEILIHMQFLLVKFSKARNGHLYINTANLESPIMNLRCIPERLDSIKKESKKWSFKNIFKRLKETCFSPKRERCPKFEQGIKKIAAHFQERIKNLVFKMLERQYLTRRGGVRVVYPECQTAQYLLPCFVATLLDVYKDPSVDQDKKKEYLKFVHNIVESYESREFCQEVTKLCKGQPQKVPFTFSALWVRDAMLIILSNHLTVSLYSKEMLTDSKVKNTLCSEFPATYFFNVDGEKQLSIPWNFQMFMILSRLKNCSVDICNQNFNIFSSSFIFMNYMLSLDSSELVDFFWNKQQDPLSQNLSARTLENNFGSQVYSFFRSLKREQFREKMSSTQGPGFPLDEIDSALWALFSGDIWTAKQKISSMTHVSGKDDQTLVSLKFAQSCPDYEEVLKTGLTVEGKVKMSSPGEITFFPVKHCRWCGLLEADTFRKCPVCVDNPDYPDVNYFCSEKCETEALDKQHTEEHATFLMIRCGIR